MILSLVSKASNLARRSFASRLTELPLKKAHNESRSRTVSTGRFVCDYEKLLKSRPVIRVRIRRIHLSSHRNALPPILVMVVRTVAKIGAVVGGRMIRKWWQKLPPEEKEEIMRKIRSKKSKISFYSTIFLGAVYLYYLENLIEDPITKRKKFIMLNQKQLNQIAEFEYRQKLTAFKSSIVPPSHPIHRRVARVANTLLLSNGDLEEIRSRIWSITVIDRPDIINAFALPHGKIFVFSGMLNLCTNDDQLAVVLAHEISHSILSHVAESMSKIFLVEFLLLIPSVIFWAIFSDAWALFSEYVMNGIANVLIHLPFSRSIEREADLVGLGLAAKSCYDVREAPVFWGKMKALNAGAPVEWMSTHPSHENRQSELREMLPEAVRIRNANNCPPLGPRFWF